MLLVVVVMVPTIGVLWFVGVAIRNEQLANRQRLSDAYQSNLIQVRAQIDAYWKAMTRELTVVGLDGQQRFDAVVDAGQVDSAICFDADGKIQYPTLPEPTASEFDDANWRRASMLEYQNGDLNPALELYRQISATTEDPLLAAFALQAQVRCLLKLGDNSSALRLVDERFGNQFSDVRDPQGRLIAANVELTVVESDPNSDLSRHIRSRLLDRLTGTDQNPLPSSQRIFLLNRMAELDPNLIDGNLLAAEDLAGQFVASHPQPKRNTALQSSQLTGVWQVATPDRRLLLLLKTPTVLKHTSTATSNTNLPSGVALNVVPPGFPRINQEITSIEAGAFLPGWRLAIINGDGPLQESTAPHERLYQWTGILVILFSSTLAIYLAITFRRHIRVANLKNDLVGTVSHELKTPLASMRLLVDTLLESETPDAKQTREYLQLIAKENTRLSRLIENFLTYSRLEQGKHTFEFRKIRVDDLVKRTVEVAGERFSAPDCRLAVEVEENLPDVTADADGLVMALLNFLDNAYKYTSPPRELTLRAFRDDRSVCFSVADNGIGLSRSAARRVFQRFYQVDQRLVRQGHGVGLGLSIVSDIAKAHGGEVSVSSRPGHGSVFTISIPIDEGVLTNADPSSDPSGAIFS